MAPELEQSFSLLRRPPNPIPDASITGDNITIKAVSEATSGKNHSYRQL